MGKFLLYISIAISIATAGIGILNKGRLATATEERDATQATLKQKEETLAQAAADKKKLDEQLAEITASNDQAKAAVASANAARDQAASESASLKDEIGKKESEIAQLKTDLETKTRELADKTSTDTPTVDPTAELKTQLAENQQLLSAAQSKLNQAEAELSDLRSKEQQRSRRAMRDGLEGRILAVNPAYNFVVLNLGDRNGVMSNSEMLIKRGNQFLGKIRVTSVEPSTSIADIVANSVPRGLAVQPGDHVIYRSVDSEME